MFLKARKKLNYIPKVSVEEGVERYLKFLKEENQKVIDDIRYKHEN